MKMILLVVGKFGISRILNNVFLFNDNGLQRFINHKFKVFLNLIYSMSTALEVVYISVGAIKCLIWPPEKILVKDDLAAE